jgi:hypothetical protein
MKGPHDRLIQGGPSEKKDKASERLGQIERARGGISPAPAVPLEPAERPEEAPQEKDKTADPCRDLGP